MDSKQQDQQDHQQTIAASDVNIDINGPDSSSGNAQVASSSMKNMSSDESARVGLTKDELMKYANEPFWIRLRNVLFATFWIVWVSILIAAIAYVVQSPGCKVASAASVAPTASTGASPTG